MQVLVTGGAGFIGSHLVDYLLAETDADISVLDDFSTGSPSNLAHVSTDRLDILQGDVRDSAAVEDAVTQADRVYHLAAAVGVKKVVQNPLESLRTNLTGTDNVLEAAAPDGTPVYLASSSEVYGKTGNGPLGEEDDRIVGPMSVPRWGYATSKAADEYLALGFQEEHGLPVVVGRFFNIVGPRQSGQYGMVIPTFVGQALANDPVTVYGDGTQTRSFSHVHDVVEIVHELMETPEAIGEVYNIGAPQPTRIIDLAERVIELTGSDSKITHVPFEEVYGEDFDEPDRRQPDVNRLRDTIGWVPDTDLDRILKDVIAEQRAQAAESVADD